MGWFDDIAGLLGTSQGNLVSSAVNAAGRLIGTATTTGANNSAADAARAGLQQGADIMASGYDASTPQLVAGINEGLGRLTAGERAAVGAYNTGADAASGRYGSIEEMGAPAITAIRATAAGNPYALTPQQQIEFEDAQRRGAQYLSTSGLRGSGRASAAVLNDLENRTRANMFATNQQRADRAQQLLGGAAINATGQRAQVDLNKGTRAANAEETIGSAGARASELVGGAQSSATLAKARAAAAAAEGAGNITANQDTANGSQWGNAIGDITGIFAGAGRNFGNSRPYYNDASGTTRLANARGGRIPAPGYAAGGTVGRAAGEAAFQQWFRGLPWHQEFVQRYGEAPDMNDPDYNYRRAYRAGVQPQRYIDGQYHWPSVTPAGDDLKGPNHPTRWMEDVTRSQGRDPNEMDGPFQQGYAKGGRVTGIALIVPKACKAA